MGGIAFHLPEFQKSSFVCGYFAAGKAAFPRFPVLQVYFS
jgi:hypothetical protein